MQWAIAILVQTLDPGPPDLVLLALLLALPLAGWAVVLVHGRGRSGNDKP